MLIFLIGYMASGKTTVGRKLARTLDFDYIDLDEYIEEKTGKSVADIFKEEGEQEFRKYERDCLQELLNCTQSVISTGGGTPCFYDNMRSIRNSGLSIYLKIPAKASMDRILKSKRKRPLVDHLTKDEMKAFIEEGLEKREAFYRKADYTVNAVNLTIPELLEQVKLKPYSK